MYVYIYVYVYIHMFITFRNIFKVLFIMYCKKKNENKTKKQKLPLCTHILYVLYILKKNNKNFYKKYV